MLHPRYSIEYHETISQVYSEHCFQNIIRKPVVKIHQKMKMKTWLILLFLNGQLVVSMAQTDLSFLPPGAYRSIYDFRNVHPFYTQEIIFSRNKYDTTDLAYYIKTYNKAEGLNKKTAKEEIFAIYQNDDLYLNCYRFSMGAGFAKVLNNGRYSYFNGCGYYNEKGTGAAMGIAVMGGIAGVSIGVGVGRFVKCKDFILDFDSGNFHPFDSIYVRWILEPHFDLLDQFKHENDKESFDVLLKYIDLVNERSEIEISK
jgi:hypothetical protein